MVPVSENASEDDAIVLANVAFAYAGKPPVFECVNLRVRRGERVALFGASGAGKSTLVELLFGLRQPAAGMVRIDGRPAHDGDSRLLRQRPRLRRRRALPAARDGRGESALWQPDGTA